MPRRAALSTSRTGGAPVTTPSVHGIANMRRRVLALLLLMPLVAGARPASQERPLPDFEAFVEQVKARLQTDSELQRGYTYTERQIERTLDGSGRVKKEAVKVFEIYPRLPGENEPYRRLIEEDGRPVDPEKLAKRDLERREKAEAYARRVAGQSDEDRARAWREYEKALEKRAEEIDDIFRVFDVQMLGRETVSGHQTIAFSLTPREDARARTDSGDMMRHFMTRAWISETDFELVRVEAEAIDNVSWGFGLLARLHKGATASFERRQVNGEAWLPARVTYEGSGRFLLVRRVRRAGESEFSDYRRFTVDTTTTIDTPAGER